MQKPIEWSPLKSAWLKQTRGICFEDIVSAIEQGDILADMAHPNPRYAHQRLYVICIEGYAYTVPYVEDDTRIFLKTIFPSRKYTRQYLQDNK